MNCVRKFVSFKFLILCIAIINHRVVVTDTVVQNSETSQIIEIESPENVTLPCHPSAFKNLTLDKFDFEWVTDNDIPIFSKGHLSPFVYLNSPEPIYSVVNNSLILRHIYANATFTCRSTRHHINYTYFLQVDHYKTGRTVQWGKHIEFRRKGETVTLPCLTDTEIGKSTAGMNYLWLLTNSQQKSIEVISLNERIFLRNNTANFRVENRSLIIPNFTPNYRIGYECHLPTGQSVSHRTSIYDEYGTEASKLLLMKKNIAVARGNDVTLNCSAIEPQVDFVWIRNEEALISIGDSLLKSSETVNFKIGTDGRSLTIANFSSSLSGTYSCISSTGQNYAYNVVEQESIFRTIEAELGKHISLPCSMDSYEEESNFVWIRNKKEVLFINGRVVVGSESDKLKIADDKRSLMIADFSYSLIGVYECRSKTGINYTYNITIPHTSNFKKQTLLVRYGTKGLILPCPVSNKSENASSEWIFESKVSSLSYYPSLLFFNKENFVSEFPDYYELKDDRSLVIKFMQFFLYGAYTCRWSTGEQYIYDLTYEITWNNHTIWVNQGENITLPCPLHDPKDQEFNVIYWGFQSQKNFWTSQYTDGKMFPSSIFHKIPDNIKLSDDKTSLMVSNITSDMEGDYSCDLIFSNTVHRYSIKIKV